MSHLATVTSCLSWTSEHRTRGPSWYPWVPTCFKNPDNHQECLWLDLAAEAQHASLDSRQDCPPKSVRRQKQGRGLMLEPPWLFSIQPVFHQGKRRPPTLCKQQPSVPSSCGLNTLSRRAQKLHLWSHLEGKQDKATLRECHNVGKNYSQQGTPKSCTKNTKLHTC